MHAHTHTHTSQGYGTEEVVFEMRKVSKEDLKELTEAEWQTETGSFQIAGARNQKNAGNVQLSEKYLLKYTGFLTWVVQWSTRWSKKLIE